MFKQKLALIRKQVTNHNFSKENSTLIELTITLWAKYVIALLDTLTKHNSWDTCPLNLEDGWQEFCLVWEHTAHLALPVCHPLQAKKIYYHKSSYLLIESGSRIVRFLYGVGEYSTSTTSWLPTVTWGNTMALLSIYACNKVIVINVCL